MSDYQRYFAEAYKKMLLEKDFDISQDSLEGAKRWLETETEPTGLSSLEDVDTETLDVVDMDAYNEDELQDDYSGKVVLECVSCHGRIMVDENKVYEDEETHTACPDIMCPVCHSELGYTILGKIEKYEAPEVEEKKDIEFPEDEEIEEEEVEVEESLHDRIRRRGLTEGKEEVCPHCGKNPCECESLEEGKDCEEPLEECGDKPFKEELDGNPARDEINGTIRNIENELSDLSTRAEDAHAFSTANAANDAYDSLESKRDSINEAAPEDIAPIDDEVKYVEEWWGQEDPSKEEFDEYGITFTKLDQNGDETLWRFEGPQEGFDKAIDDGYFMSIQYEKDEGNNLDESLTESVNNLSLDTDDTHLEMTADENGRISVISEPTTAPMEEVPDTAVPGEDSVVPLDNSDVEEIENNIEPEMQDDILGTEEDISELAPEEEAPAEEMPEEEVPEEEFGEEEFEVEEESFNYLGNTFAKKLYENVANYKTTSGYEKDGKLIIEGIISFNSGKSKKTQFIFENAKETKTGRIILEGINNTFFNDKAFKLRGKIREGKFISEALKYDYSINRLNESTGATEPIAVRGTIRTK